MTISQQDNDPYGEHDFGAFNWEQKRTILRDLGQNPVILDGKLIITPHPWIVPIEKGYKEIEAEYMQVRTLPEHLHQDPMEAIRLKWLGMRDSNLLQIFDGEPRDEVSVQRDIEAIRQLLSEDV